MQNQIDISHWPASKTALFQSENDARIKRIGDKVFLVFDKEEMEVII